jgi:hypothetical protein
VRVSSAPLGKIRGYGSHHNPFGVSRTVYGRFYPLAGLQRGAAILSGREPVHVSHAPGDFEVSLCVLDPARADQNFLRVKSICSVFVRMKLGRTGRTNVRNGILIEGMQTSTEKGFRSRTRHPCWAIRGPSRLSSPSTDSWLLLLPRPPVCYLIRKTLRYQASPDAKVE